MRASTACRRDVVRAHSPFAPALNRFDSCFKLFRHKQAHVRADAAAPRGGSQAPAQGVCTLGGHHAPSLLQQQHAPRNSTKFVFVSVPLLQVSESDRAAAPAPAKPNGIPASSFMCYSPTMQCTEARRCLSPRCRHNTSYWRCRTVRRMLARVQICCSLRCQSVSPFASFVPRALHGSGRIIYGIT